MYYHSRQLLLKKKRVLKINVEFVINKGILFFSCFVFALYNKNQSHEPFVVF